MLYATGADSGDKNKRGKSKSSPLHRRVKNAMEDVGSGLDLKHSFRDFDRHNDGFVSRAEFRRAISAAGVSLKRADVDDLADEYDRDGKIRWEDFVLDFGNSSHNVERGGRDSLVTTVRVSCHLTTVFSPPPSASLHPSPTCNR